MMDIDELIERMEIKDFDRDYDCTPFECGAFGLLDAAAAVLSTYQIENQELRNAANGFKYENEKLRAELDKVKRGRDAAVALVHEWEQYGRYLSSMGFTVPPNWKEDEHEQ